ncbi:hypothetical protein FDECE_15737 [Fusarium decemcellulare]|nr:hypothetical protein FDECE_15737 [Fusarium decemcellulare]
MADVDDPAPDVPDARPAAVLAAQIRQDPNLVATRPAGALVTDPSHLTAAEKINLIDLIEAYASMYDPPTKIQQHDLEGLLTSVFGGWDTSVDEDEIQNPILEKRSVPETRLHVGHFRVTLPLSKNQKAKSLPQKPERMAGAKAYLSLALNPERMASAKTYLSLAFMNSEQELLLPGWTINTAKAKAVRNYDTAEKTRIAQYNFELIVACARRWIKRWAADGTDVQPVANANDIPNNIQPLVLASSYIHSIAAAYSRLLDFLQGPPPEDLMSF